MQKPVFSVIVPVYKVPEKYLRECIESILNQTFDKIEVILVDDGSPDTCGVICDEYAKNDSRITVIHQDNQGVSVARNNGIKAAKADWIMFVDGDDWIELDACERLSKYLCDTDADMIMFRAWKNYASNCVELKYGIKGDRWFNMDVYDDRELLYRKVMQPLNMAKHPVSTCTFYYSIDKIYSRKFLITNSIEYPQGIPVSEDKVFILSCFEHLNKLHFVNERLYHYRINSQSVTRRYSETIDEDRRKLILMLRNIAIRLDAQLAQHSGNNQCDIMQRELDLFVAHTVFGILMRKYFHADWPYSQRLRKKEAKKFLASEPFKTALETIEYKQLSPKNIFKVWLVRNRLLYTFEFFVGIVNKLKKQGSMLE